MKKFYKVLATAFAMALVVTSPSATITSHAFGFNPDAPEHMNGDGERPSDMGKDSGSSNNGSSNSGSSSGGSSGGSSSDNSGSSDNGGSYDNGNSSDNGGSSDNGSSYSGNTANNPNDVTVGTTGGQKFRNVMNDKHTSYEVYHCGVSKVTFTVTDANGNAVAYSTIKLEQDENGLWYENIIFAEGVDTKGLTLNVTKGDHLYLGTELGVRGIKINGKVVLLTIKTNGFNADAPEHSNGDGKRPSKN